MTLQRVAVALFFCFAPAADPREHAGILTCGVKGCALHAKAGKGNSLPRKGLLNQAHAALHDMLAHGVDPATAYAKDYSGFEACPPLAFAPFTYNVGDFAATKVLSGGCR